MACILNVHPGSGRHNDSIEIVVEYDDGGTPDVSTVVFAEGADASQFNVTARDSAHNKLTLVVKVPDNATTGPIEVDLRGCEPIRTTANFTVTQAPVCELRIQNIIPPMPAEGYKRLTQLRLQTYPAPDPNSLVYFPNVTNGPPIVGPLGPVQIQQNIVIVTIPYQARTGRVKVLGQVAPRQVAALTRVLTFIA